MAQLLRISTAAAVISVAVAGCTNGGGVTPLGGAAPPLPDLDRPAIERGQRLYATHCASCHGADLGGEPDWKEAGSDGKYPAPPHDATGHTWHHSDQLLLSLIRDGIDAGPTNMPQYAGVLSDGEMGDIIEFFKSTWPEQERVFQWQVTWQEANR